MLRDETTFVVGPSGRGEDGLESSGWDGCFRVGRPGEEYIADVEDEGCRFCKRHDCTQGLDVDGENPGNIA